MSADIVSAMREEILKGSFAPGAFLPPTRELSAEHGVCFETVRRALKLLEAEGLLEAVPRQGFRVTDAAALPATVCPVAYVTYFQPDLSDAQPVNWAVSQALQASAARRGWTVLGAHSGQVVIARGLREGENRIACHCDLDLVITDVSLPDGDGFALLKSISLLEDPKPRVILIARYPAEEEERRASAMGAIGYLGKPICFRDIAGVLRRHGGNWNTQRKLRRRTSGRACLLERNGSRDTHKPALLFWYIRDLSASGAFLETESPIPVGRELELYLEEGADSGFRTVFATDSSHPYVDAWWPPGHILGYQHTFVHTVLDLLIARKVAGVDIPVLGAADLELTPNAVGETGARVRLLELSLPPTGERAEILEGSAEEVAAGLVSKIKEQGVL